MESGDWRRCEDMTRLRLTNKWVRRLAIAAGIFGVLFVWSTYPWVYWAKPIEATVVDAETQEPLEGVIVVAMWILEGGYHNDEVGFLEVLETVTDSKGRFHFDSWGPVWRPGWGVLDAKDPRMYLFKDGYRYKQLLNGHQGRSTTGAMGRRSTWSGETIPLERFEGDVDEYARSLSYLSNRIEPLAHRSLMPHWSCEWQKIPRLILAIEKVEIRRKVANPRSMAELMTTEEIAYVEVCGSASDFFKNHRP